jgi:hypothetical protein
MNNSKFLLSSSKSGFAIFVALGAIVMLTILIFSYNLLVQGKSNESRNMLNHTRALKAAQATSRYIFAKIQKDLNETITNNKVKTAFIENDASVFKSYLDEIKYQDVYLSICGPSNLSQTINATIEFPESEPLSKYQKGNEIYLNSEKAGRLTITLEAKIDKNRELWKESRPYRVALPFPLGLTKFTLYLKNPTNGNEYGLNKVQVEDGTQKGKDVLGMAPLVIDNGSGIFDNKTPDIWKMRGWIYLGNGKHYLNRAAGDTPFGQHYHSYIPGSGDPKAIPVSLDNKYNNDNGFVSIGTSADIHIRSARWGFATYTKNDGTWSKVLNSNSLFNKTEHYYSTWLHLFGDANFTSQFYNESYRAGFNKQNRAPSITRVVGNVFDRFMEISYLVANKGTPPDEVIGAIKQFSEYDFSDKQSEDKIEDELFIKSPTTTLFSNEDDLTDFREFFSQMSYESTSTDLAYKKIMSRMNMNTTYRDVYASIAQYATDRVIDTPPRQTFYKDVPECSDDNFLLPIKNTSKSTPDEMPPISKLGEVTLDPTLGMANRITYLISSSNSQNPVEDFKNAFCKNGKYNLQNAVIKISGNNPVKLDNMPIQSGGAVITESSMTFGGNPKPSTSDYPPMMLMSEKGSITLESRTEAYLIALDDNKGEIKPSSAQLEVFGGIATNKMSPCPGMLIYNPAFDPINDKFQSYLGVVLGPEGGDI